MKLKKENKWIRDLLKEEPFGHTEKSGVIYNSLLDGYAKTLL